MKLYLKTQRNNGWSRFELFVVVLIVCFIFFILLAMLVPMRAMTIRRAQNIRCVSNLKQINLALRIWEGDNNNQYPMQISVLKRGAKELIAAGNVAGFFQSCLPVVSNELSAPRILFCPADTQLVPATNFTSDFNNSHISYFVCPDASETYPQMVLDGDDNLAVNGVPVKPGILQITNCDSISWTKARHGGLGNIGFADGSVAEESALGLQYALQCATNGTPFVTNRLAIP